MIFLKLFFEFFKVGLFAVGGGLATLPFLYDLAYKTGWFDAAELINILAVSESTPGPMGVNMATYTGFTIHGILGGIIATSGLVLPSVIICVTVEKFLERFKENKTVDAVFSGLRPASMALVTMAGIGVITGCLIFPDKIISGELSAAFNIKGIIFAVILFLLMRKFKAHPIVFIAISAVAGVLIGF